MSRKQLYSLVIIAAGIGCGWLVYSIWNISRSVHIGSTVCMFKKITGLPCPSCGATRAIITLLKGHWEDSLLINPLGVLLLLSLFIFPVWVGCDFVKKRKSFWLFYLKTEQQLRKRRIAIPFVLLIVVNWVWNIYKHI